MTVWPALEAYKNLQSVGQGRLVQHYQHPSLIFKTSSPAPTRLVFSQQHANQTNVHNYTNRAVVTPQAASAYRGTLQANRICDPLRDDFTAAGKSIRLQDFHKLSSIILIQLALFDCETVALTAASSGFPAGVILAARQEKKALKELLKSKEKIREEAGQLIRGNEAWIVSVFEVWLAIH